MIWPWQKKEPVQPEENTADQTDNANQAESVVETAVEPEAKAGTGLFTRWRAGLGKTRAGLGSAFGALLGGKRSIDEDLLEEIETLLLVADVGINTTQNLIDAFRQRVRKGVPADQDLMHVFRQLLIETLSGHSGSLDLGESKPGVVMMVGVNGVGKTTSIGKLAKRFQSRGKSVVLAAGDTFRAAAVEQLQVWGERNSVPVIAQATGSDSASVIYDALESSKAKRTDVLIADTAGRLHNKGSLMEELSKIVRVIKKLDETAPHEILLVLDAGTGQNALSQAREFCKSVPVTGLILTKLDGTAKGGVVFALVEQLQIPVKFVGLGEGIDDLAEFDPESFVSALFD
ncbi:MAG: signal recognition particle-docking protein FtsY [Porticoccaceae bacterium]